MTVSITNDLGRSKITIDNTVHVIEYYRDDLDRNGSRFGNVDTVLVMDGGALAVHGALLAASSSWFKAILHSNMFSFHGTKEVLMPGFNLQIMKIVMKLMYHGECFVGSESVGKEVIATIKYLHFHSADKLEVILSGGNGNSSNESRASSVSTSGQQNDQSNNSSRKPKQATNSGISNPAFPPPRIQTQPVISAKVIASAHPTVTKAPPPPPMIRTSRSESPDRTTNSSTTSDIQHKSSDSLHQIVATTSDRSSVSALQQQQDQPMEVALLDPGDVLVDPTNLSLVAAYIRTCQGCKTSYRSPYNANSCIKNHDLQRCYFCFLLLPKEFMLAHFIAVHAPDGDSTAAVPCSICQAPLKRGYACSHYYTNHHFIKKEKSKRAQMDVPSSPVSPDKKRQRLSLPDSSEKAADLNSTPVTIGTLSCIARQVEKNNRHWLLLKVSFPH